MEESPSTDVIDLKRMSLSEILSNTLNIFGKGFIQFAVITVLGSVVIWMATFLWGFRVISSINTISAPSALEIIGVIVLGILSWLLTAWMNGALVHMASTFYADSTPAISTSLKRATKRLPKMLGAQLMLTLILLLPGLFIAAIFFSFTVVSPILGIVVIVILMPLSVYFWIKWAFMAQAVCIEDTGSLEAISRSSDLVRDYWWHTFGYLLVLYIIMGITSSVLSFIPFIGQIISAIIVTPITIIGTTLIYWDLRSRWSSVNMDTVKAELDTSRD